MMYSGVIVSYSALAASIRALSSQQRQIYCWLTQGQRLRCMRTIPLQFDDFFNERWTFSLMAGEVANPNDITRTQSISENATCPSASGLL
ncbi:hypothetical protein IW261DRAFT_1493895 [Armillaria novae-zelandiae]|uniref:Uncharacterized protein n=1 Tax=Armillaria novae-zelandiae TaxID=153914 RepID=A0AA39P129_9AGAR|nr:hypothetical protein IW261DRAFT_1493895 [Armillaria novae-zelandiae]